MKRFGRKQREIAWTARIAFPIQRDGLVLYVRPTKTLAPPPHSHIDEARGGISRKSIVKNHGFDEKYPSEIKSCMNSN